MDFDIIKKILEKNGGYPNIRILRMFKAIGLSKVDFLKSMISKFGMEGAEQFIQQSLLNFSKNGKIRVSPGDIIAQGYEINSFIELDFKDVRVKIVELDENSSIIELHDLIISDSNIVVETEDGEIEIYDLDGLIDSITEEDPYGYSEVEEYIVYGVRKDLESFLGCLVYFDKLPDKRE